MRTLFFIQIFLLTCFSLELNGKCTDKQISDCYKDFERHIGHRKVCRGIANYTEVCLKDLQRDFKCPLSDKIDAVQVEMRLCKKGFHFTHQCPGHYTCWSKEIYECRRQYRIHKYDEGACGAAKSAMECLDRLNSHCQTRVPSVLTADLEKTLELCN